MFAARKTSVAQATAAALADAIDFDGTNDYLSRSSDLVGNKSSNTFTISFWICSKYLASAPSVTILHCRDTNGGTIFKITRNASNGDIQVIGNNSGGSTVIDVTVAGVVTNETFTHINISVDLSNASNRHIYVNGVPTAATWASYSNAYVDFSSASNVWRFFSDTTGGNYLLGRLAHFYLDHTYRDISIEANRRLFITADRKPAANQAALNPILYLPLNDPTQPGKNLGTGGDFTLTGVVARSGRGPSQFNAPYSTFDGAADYLSKTSGLTIPSTKVFTLQMVVMPTTPNGDTDDIVYIQNSATSQGINLRYIAYGGSTNGFYLELKNSTGYIFVGYVAPFSTSNQNRNYILTLAIDMDNQSNCRAYLNGVAATMSISTFNTGQSLPILSKASIGVSTDFVGNFYGWYSGTIGALWFNTSYIDLSQPANLAKFVTGTGIDAKPADLGANGELPFGTPPLIYLPMYGNNAGKNYGSGGDFTVNSGPFPGARGPNEFWGNKAVFDGTTGKLTRTTALAISNSKTVSASFNCSTSSGGVTKYYFFQGASVGFHVRTNGSNQLVINARNAAGSTVLTATVNSPTVPVDGSNAFVQFCLDLSDSAKRWVYINGAVASVSWSVYSNDTMKLDGANTYFGNDFDGSNTFYNGSLSEFYFTTDYIDFSQEANRLKFRDAFGNPVDLAPQIAAGTLPNPAIYMRFDPANFGKNSGTGGDFTVSGTITDGGQL